MNKNIFLAALVASCAYSGSALSATNASSTTALAALPTVDTSWVVSVGWASIDSTKTPNTGAWDATITGASDPCGDNWAGIYCDGNDITHIEIPNAKMSGTLAEVFTALAPIKSQLISINVSSTEEADRNILSGPIPVDGSAINYPLLRYLGLNYIGASGDIPDLTSNSALVVANFYGNSFTSYTGPVGGTDLSFLGLHENDGMSGDLTASLANSPSLFSMSSYGTSLVGGLNGVENIALAAGVGDGTLNVSWSAPSAGVVPDAYEVDLSSDEGESWISLPDVTAPNNTAAADSLTDGTYIARITPKTNAGLVGSVQGISEEFTLGASGTGSTGGTSGGTGGTSTGSGSSSGGGGAALWILALPLLGRFRR